MTASVTHAAHGARLASAESVCRGTSLTQTDRQTDRRLCAVSHCGLGPKGGTAALGGPSDFQAAATPSRTCAARYGLPPWGGRCSVAASARREEDGSEGPSHVTGPRGESRAEGAGSRTSRPAIQSSVYCARGEARVLVPQATRSRVQVLTSKGSRQAVWDPGPEAVRTALPRPGSRPLSERRGLYSRAPRGCRRTHAWIVSQGAGSSLQRVISFPSAARVILPRMMDDAIPLRGRRQGGNAEGKKPPVELGKPRGRRTREEKGSEAAGVARPSRTGPNPRR